MSYEGYDPRRSKVSDTTLEEFKVAVLTGNLTQVPGIGKVSMKKLKNNGIENSFQLIGRYMSTATMAGNKIDTYLLNQEFYQFLKGCKISSCRSAIVLAISQKVTMSFPNFLDLNVYDDDDDDDEDEEDEECIIWS